MNSRYPNEVMSEKKGLLTKLQEEDYNLTQALLDASGDDDNEEEDEVESKALLRSDPSKWKTQDHYAVLGLSKKRYMANDEDIKRACKLRYYSIFQIYFCTSTPQITN